MNLIAKKVFFALLLPFLLFGSSAVFAQNTQLPTPPEPPLNSSSPTDQVIVSFRSYTPKFIRDRLHRQFAASSIRPLRRNNLFTVRLPAGTAEVFAQRYQQSAWVEYAEPDYIATAVEIPNDPYFPDQWGQVLLQLVQ